jgi:hypothetical protein
VKRREPSIALGSRFECNVWYLAAAAGLLPGIATTRLLSGVSTGLSGTTRLLSGVPTGLLSRVAAWLSTTWFLLSFKRGLFVVLAIRHNWYRLLSSGI